MGTTSYHTHPHMFSARTSVSMDNYGVSMDNYGVSMDMEAKKALSVC